jgi:hypothetical protein
VLIAVITLAIDVLDSNFQSGFQVFLYSNLILLSIYAAHRRVVLINRTTTLYFAIELSVHRFYWLLLGVWLKDLRFQTLTAS